MVDYELVDGHAGTYGNRYSWWRICALVIVYITTTLLVFISWNRIYGNTTLYPDTSLNVPEWWHNRALFYAKHMHEHADISHDIRLVRNQTQRPKTTRDEVGIVTSTKQKRLVCYFDATTSNGNQNTLRLQDVVADLCTHINIGMAIVLNSSIVLPTDVAQVLLTEVPVLRKQNPALKLLLWVGGAESNSNGFSDMVKNHANRKIFVRSLKAALHEYQLDGVDLDWEFPSAYNKERQHLSQLMYEIRQEYRREKLNYLLSVAVAAPEGIALYAYDISELNKFADHVNLMTYDFHFYTHETPFTGLNAPLYARPNEHSILSTLNINASVHWWLSNGLDPDKLIVGLPTYGHSFTLVNPFNNAIGAPAEAVGSCGDKGFVTYGELCWFQTHNLASTYFDKPSCSPYLTSDQEWISFEQTQSIACKAEYVRKQQLGGIMAFSLNTDDFRGVCSKYVPQIDLQSKQGENVTFPLIRAMKKIIFASPDGS